MPRYGRRFRRGGRPRRFGGRRRARRPSAARAVVRGSFAPRQQYLKLKHSVTWYTFIRNDDEGPDGGSSNYFTINLGQMNHPYDQEAFVYAPAGLVAKGVWWSQYAEIPVLGYNQYSQLFKRYVVNSTKVSINGVVNYPQRVSTENTANTVGGNSWPTGGMPVTYTRAYAPQSYADFPADTLWGMMPHGRTLICDNGRFHDKMYVKHNALQGGIVKQHDRYVRNWADVTTQTDAAGAFANLLGFVHIPSPITTPYTAGSQISATITMRIDLTFYVTAQVVYAYEGVSPAMMALAKEMTVPSTEPIGDLPPPPSLQLASAARGELVGLEEQQAVGRIPKRSFTD